MIFIDLPAAHQWYKSSKPQHHKDALLHWDVHCEIYANTPPCGGMNVAAEI